MAILLTFRIRFVVALTDKSLEKLNFGDPLLRVFEFGEPFIMETGGGGSRYGGRTRICGVFGSGGSLYDGGVFL